MQDLPCRNQKLRFELHSTTPRIEPRNGRKQNHHETATIAQLPIGNNRTESKFSRNSLSAYALRGHSGFLGIKWVPVTRIHRVRGNDSGQRPVDWGNNEREDRDLHVNEGYVCAVCNTTARQHPKTHARLFILTRSMEKGDSARKKRNLAGKYSIWTYGVAGGTFIIHGELPEYHQKINAKLYVQILSESRKRFSKGTTATAFSVSIVKSDFQ